MMHPLKGPVFRYVPDPKWFVEAVVHGFNPRFNAEDFTWLTEITKGRLEIGVGGRVVFTEASTGYNQPSYLLAALVSFCTIAPAKSASHQERYGKHVIGLSKTWAKANGLRRLVYLNRDDVLSSRQKSEVVLELRKRPLPVAKILERWPDLPFWKPVIGAMPVRDRDRFTTEQWSNIDDFYQEREIRYVPDQFLPKMELTHNINSTHDRMDELTKLTAGFFLKFADDDVTEIVVEAEATRKRIARARPGLAKKVHLWSELTTVL